MDIIATRKPGSEALLSKAVFAISAAAEHQATAITLHLFDHSLVGAEHAGRVRPGFELVGPNALRELVHRAAHQRSVAAICNSLAHSAVVLQLGTDLLMVEGPPNAGNELLSSSMHYSL